MSRFYFSKMKAVRRNCRRHPSAGSHNLQPTPAPPDLAVEVLSRSTEVRDRGRKMQLLARFGVPEYWIADPVQNRLEVYTLQDGEYELIGIYDEHEDATSPTLPGLSFAAGRLFEE
jgi:Uma2 family endonuclease